MSNIFLIDQGVSSNTLTVNADSIFSGSFSLDGYLIDPTNATNGQVLMYNGSAYLASTIQESNVANLVSDLAAKTSSSRLINTVSGQLIGGGDLSADRTLGLATSGVNTGTYMSVTVDAYGRVTAGTNPSISWTNVTYQNSYVDNGGGWAPSSYSIDSLGVVRLRGAAKNGTAGATIFTLPVGFRPAYNTTFATVVNNASGFVHVYSNGDVSAASGGTTNVDFSVISFVVA